MTVHGERVAVFDFDGVLTRRDTFAEVVRRSARSAPWLGPAIAPLAMAMLMFTSNDHRRGEVARLIVRVAMVRRDLDRTECDLSRLGAELGRSPRWVNAQCVDRIREHLAAGDRVVVVTATEHHLARSVLNALDLRAVELLASSLRPVRGGLAMDPHLYGERKVRALRGHGVRQWAVAYSDSRSDVRVLDGAEEVVVINASRRLRRWASRRYGSASTFLRW